MLLKIQTVIKKADEQQPKATEKLWSRCLQIEGYLNKLPGFQSLSHLDFNIHMRECSCSLIYECAVGVFRRRLPAGPASEAAVSP